MYNLKLKNNELFLNDKPVKTVYINFNFMLWLGTEKIDEFLYKGIVINLLKEKYYKAPIDINFFYTPTNLEDIRAVNKAEYKDICKLYKHTSNMKEVIK